MQMSEQVPSEHKNVIIALVQIREKAKYGWFQFMRQGEHLLDSRVQSVSRYG